MGNMGMYGNRTWMWEGRSYVWVEKLVGIREHDGRIWGLRASLTFFIQNAAFLGKNHGQPPCLFYYANAGKYQNSS